ncbi:MAG: ABC transporter permease [Actinomycetota bacterium]
MRPGELMRTALHSLRINPLRAALSVLGVTMGIMAVILLISIGQGVRSQVEDQIKGLGTDLLVVKSGQEEVGADVNPATAVLSGQLNTSSLVQADVGAVGKVEGVEAACGVAEQLDVIQAGDKALNCKIIGGDEGFRKVRKLEFAETEEGWSFEGQEPRTCAIGQFIAENLFGKGNEVVGKTIKIAGNDFTVKALLVPREKSMFLDPNKEVYIPIADARDLFGAPGTDRVREIDAKLSNPATSKAVVKEIESRLAPAHSASYEEANPGSEWQKDFYVATQDDLMSSYDAIMSILNALVIGVAAIALVESAIGVSNIMYVSVRERTREIGVRLAQGASKKAILAQFLFESMTICLIGAAIGVPLGWLISALLDSFTPLPAQTPLWGVLVAFGAAALVGVLAGVYPAWKATKADIAVALKAE